MLKLFLHAIAVTCCLVRVDARLKLKPVVRDLTSAPTVFCGPDVGQEIPIPRFRGTVGSVMEFDEIWNANRYEFCEDDDNIDEVGLRNENLHATSGDGGHGVDEHFEDLVSENTNLGLNLNDPNAHVDDESARTNVMLPQFMHRAWNLVADIDRAIEEQITMMRDVGGRVRVHLLRFFVKFLIACLRPFADRGAQNPFSRKLDGFSQWLQGQSEAGDEWMDENSDRRKKTGKKKVGGGSGSKKSKKNRGGHGDRRDCDELRNNSGPKGPVRSAANVVFNVVVAVFIAGMLSSSLLPRWNRGPRSQRSSDPAHDG